MKKGKKTFSVKISNKYYGLKIRSDYIFKK